MLPKREVQARCEKIWEEYLAPEATSTINIDSKSHEQTKLNIADHPDRYAFDVAAVSHRFLFLTVWHNWPSYMAL